jgi:hypothetical protein
MLKLIITKFWPILIPVTIYILWHIFIFKRVKDKDEAKRKLAYYYLTVGGLCATIISILLIFYTESGQQGRYDYVPAKTINGKIIPAQIK